MFVMFYFILIFLAIMYLSVIMTGQNCEQYINPCDEAPCINNGSCTPDGSTFRCVCTIGFEGETCDQPWVTCREGFCQNGGHCGPLGGTEFCVCLPGFKGNSIFFIYVEV